MARRPRTAVLWVALVAASCSHGAEKQTLQRFFEASRLRDRTALGSMATVIFEPSTDGIVTSFAIASVSPPETIPVSRNPSGVRLVELSLPNLPPSLDIAHEAGELTSESVKISAPVKLPSGQIASKTINLILARATLTGQRTYTGRWVVTGFSAYAP